jgi:hypothetical protein
MLLAGKNIAPTENTPGVVLDPEGVIQIRGRSSKNNPLEFYKQVENWIDDYIQNPPDLTRMDICLEYINDSNSTIFRSLLRKVSNVRLKGKKLVINWCFEEDDEDILAEGEHLSFVFNIPINFISFSKPDNEFQ